MNIKEYKTNRLQHMIGRVVLPLIQLFTTRQTVDNSIPDYAWWDRFRHSREKGYEISGSAAKTINQIVTNWVLGRGVSAKLKPVDDKRMQAKIDYTNKQLGKFMASIQGDIQSWYMDYEGLGDLYVLVQPDGDVCEVPPNTVQLIQDPEYPLQTIEMKMITITDSVTVLESFTAAYRDRVVARYTGRSPAFYTSLVAGASGLQTINLKPNDFSVLSAARSPNLIGRIPIVHFANNKGSNEIHGHPSVEDERFMYSEFDDLANKSMQGAKVSGNPVPVFENLDDPEETILLNSTETDETYTDKDGNEEKRRLIKWDQVPAFFLGTGGKFTFAAPPVGFSTDTIGMLKFFRGLIRDAAHTPGYVFGGDDTINPNQTNQTPAWSKFIETRRDKFAGKPYDEDLSPESCGGLYELIYIWLKTKSLTDPKIYVGPVEILWQEISEEDAKQNFEVIKWLQSRGGISTKTALRLFGLVEDPDAEYEAAQEELKANAPLMQPTTDFSGTQNPVKNPPPVKGNNTPDLRAGVGADAPRMPSYAGGGRR